MKFTKKILKNGLRVVAVPMKENPAVTVYVMVEAGAKYETKETNGISHFLEHMVFKGTPRRPKATAIAREFDGLGAEFNAFTGDEYTGYYAKVDKKHLDKALDIISDMYLNPLFPEDEIKKEKGVIIEEIRMYRDRPDRHVQDELGELMFRRSAGRLVRPWAGRKYTIV
jgi:predicted Zn-dependent peptidase